MRAEDTRKCVACVIKVHFVPVHRFRYKCFYVQAKGNVYMMNETQVSPKSGLSHFTYEMFTALLMPLLCTIYQRAGAFASCANYPSYWF